MTDSRAVAIAFGKQHAKVMRTIKAMLASRHPEIAQHGRANFGESSYINAQGKQQPMYRMTAKGLSELAMSFSGDKARVIRSRPGRGPQLAGGQAGGQKSNAPENKHWRGA